MTTAERVSFLQVAGVERNVTLDALRVLLAVMVVGIHARLFSDVAPLLNDALENYAFRIAVPIFFLINGYFLHAAIRRGRTAWRWAGRILPLYITWTIAYSYFFVTKGPAATINTVAVGFMHLWYLPATMLGGLMVYSMRSLGTRKMLALAGLAYAAGWCMQYAGNYHLAHGAADAWLNKSFVYRNFLFFGFPFLACGFLAAREGVAQRVSTSALWGAGLAGAILLALEFVANHALRMPAGDVDLLLGLPLACGAAFLAASRGRVATTRMDLAGLSSAIYFAHPLFVLLAPLVLVGLPSVSLLVAAVAGCVALYPMLKALNQRWPVFL